MRTPGESSDACSLMRMGRRVSGPDKLRLNSPVFKRLLQAYLASQHARSSLWCEGSVPKKQRQLLSLANHAHLLLPALYRDRTYPIHGCDHARPASRQSHGVSLSSRFFSPSLPPFTDSTPPSLLATSMLRAATRTVRTHCRRAPSALRLRVAASLFPSVPPHPPLRSLPSRQHRSFASRAIVEPEEEDEGTSADVLPRAEHAVISTFGAFLACHFSGCLLTLLAPDRPLFDWRRPVLEPHCRSHAGGKDFCLGMLALSRLTVDCLTDRLFVQDLKDLGILEKVRKLKIGLYGSLAATGKGHLTPEAIMMGLEGSDPETIECVSLHRRKRVKLTPLDFQDIDSQLSLRCHPRNRSTTAQRHAHDLLLARQGHALAHGTLACSPKRHALLGL